MCQTCARIDHLGDVVQQRCVPSLNLTSRHEYALVLTIWQRLGWRLADAVTSTRLASVRNSCLALIDSGASAPALGIDAGASFVETLSYSARQYPHVGSQGVEPTPVQGSRPSQRTRDVRLA